MQKLIVFASLVVVCLAAAGSQVGRQEGFGIECSGDSGHIKLFNDDGRWVLVKPDQVSIAGIGTLTISQFAWQDPVYSNVEGVEPQNIKALTIVGTKSGTIGGNQINLKLVGYFFNATSADMTYLGQVISVAKFGVKFSGEVDFPNGAPVTTSKLQWGWTIEAKGDQKQNRDRQGGGKMVEFQDGASVAVPSKCKRNTTVIDDMTVDAYANGRKYTVTLSLPVDDHVSFDPILALGTGGAAATSFFAALCLVFVALLLL